MVTPAPLASSTLRVLLYEGNGSEEIDDARRHELMRGLLNRGYPVTRVLPGGSVGSYGSDPLLVLGRFPGGTPQIEDRDGAVPVRCLDIGDSGVEEIFSRVEESRETEALPSPGKWKPWFPVIDYDRCTNCMQCLSFCLFDVYSVENKTIKVQNESNCKTDCPACSRVCPEVAILFPKYKSGPINGDEIDPEDLRREAMKVDISALLGGDIYAMLRDRSAKAKSRFSRERDDERALKERQRCLTKLQEKLDIPTEVLSSLPSPDQIRANAARAQSRAAEALAETSDG